MLWHEQLKWLERRYYLRQRFSYLRKEQGRLDELNPTTEPEKHLLREIELLKEERSKGLLQRLSKLKNRLENIALFQKDEVEILKELRIEQPLVLLSKPVLAQELHLLTTVAF